jgi:hypothetical protein
MIILLDGNVWEKLAEFFENGISKSGTVILERHFIDDHNLHWVYDLTGKKLLGRLELTSIIHTKISSIHEKHVKAAGFGSKEMLKRTFALCLGYQLAREVNLITVAQMKIAEIERYSCPKCFSTNLDYITKNIFGNQLPFSCFDCGKEFYTEDKDEGSPRIKNARLEKRYCQKEIKKIPAGQEKVLAVVGENWFEV